MRAMRTPSIPSRAIRSIAASRIRSRLILDYPTNRGETPRGSSDPRSPQVRLRDHLVEVVDGALDLGVAAGGVAGRADAELRELADLPVLRG